MVSARGDGWNPMFCWGSNPTRGDFRKNVQLQRDGSIIYQNPIANILDDLKQRKSQLWFGSNDMKIESFPTILHWFKHGHVLTKSKNDGIPVLRGLLRRAQLPGDCMDSVEIGTKRKFMFERFQITIGFVLYLYSRRVIGSVEVDNFFWLKTREFTPRIDMMRFQSCGVYAVEHNFLGIAWIVLRLVPNESSCSSGSKSL